MGFLLNISNKSDFQLPSKSVDYMATGKPVINICSIEKDLFKAFFKDYSLILNLLFIKDSITQNKVDELVSFLEKSHGAQLRQAELAKRLESFEVKTISQDYLNCLFS